MVLYKKTQSVFLLVLVLLFTFSACTPDVQSELRIHAEKENKNYPRALGDGITVIDSCAALPNKTLRYYYTTNLHKNLIDTALIKSSLTPQLVSTIKVDPGTAFFKKNGVIFQYYYRDFNGQDVCLIEITPKDYNDK